MILGLGIDLVDKERVKKVFDKFEKKMISRILSVDEINEFYKKENKVDFISKRFSVKESFLKAVGIGIGRGINFSDITIKNNVFGKPEIYINNNAKNFLKKYYSIYDDINFFVSITDEKNLINTVVVIEYDKI